MQMTIAAGTQDLWAALSFGRRQAGGRGASAFTPFQDRGTVVDVTPVQREIASETQAGAGSLNAPPHSPPGLVARPRPLTYGAPRASQAAPALHYATPERGRLVDVFA